MIASRACDSAADEARGHWALIDFAVIGSPQTALFDGLGRRIKKVVSNSGDLDATTVYYYNGQQILETRDGSGTMVSQVYHGTRYIDEVVGLRLPDGRAYVHQDANYNVIGLTDLTGRVLERYYYSPYGELEVAFDAHFFDYDDDGDVDEQDLAAATSGGECWGDYSGDCRRLDADSDRDIDAADHTAISSFIDELSGDQEIQRTPAPTRSQLGNPFAHQGLVFDAEIGSYQNRARQYNPRLKRFMQRDPLALRLSWPRRDRAEIALYEYGESTPLVRRDPTGLWSGWYQCRWVEATPCQHCNLSCLWTGILCQWKCNLIACCTVDDPCPGTPTGPGPPTTKCDCSCTLKFPWIWRTCGNPTNCRGSDYPADFRRCTGAAAGHASCPSIGTRPITGPTPTCP
jgi:RHS repeat-associated protein